jgi:hypothetical protein
MLASVQKDQYVVVAGPKGVGKSCMVDTALQATCGVVFLRVPAGASEREILTDAFLAITRSSIRSMDHSSGARRVLWWHHFLFLQRVTVVLRAAERGPGQPAAALHGAARALSQDFGARVLIDACNNSLPEHASATKREKLLELEPMQRELLETIPALLPLHEALKEARLADLVWLWTGGNPADYKSLWGLWQDQQGMEQPMSFEHVVAAFVMSLRSQALENVNAVLASNKRMQALFARCSQGAEGAPSSLLRDMELVRASPDKVLRLVRRISIDSLGELHVQRFLIPADAATAAVLSRELR